MCGIAGLVSLSRERLPQMERALAVMGRLIAHRGPDGKGAWASEAGECAFVHRRLAIVDLSPAAAQPMAGAAGATIAFNGEIYNHMELRERFRAAGRAFRSTSDTECILAAYEREGDECLQSLRGMFAFALWDERRKRLFCARDRFGIKPFYYAVVRDVLYFASEAKALLPFLPEIETDPAALAEYMTFQYTLGEHTLFKGIKQLLPGHSLTVENGTVKVRRYWDVRYEIDFDHSPRYFQNRLVELLDESVSLHLRSDVPVGAYISGGIDSSLMAVLASRGGAGLKGFHGRFTEFPGYDESHYARLAGEATGADLHVLDITADDFREHIRHIIYHLDFPVAGPGAFPQFMVSKMASEQVKVVLGGQGGDEIFGGYARYLLAYFEQCIVAAMDGSYKNGNFVVTIESIIPNLGLLREYKPLMGEFWREGLFGPLDERYLRLVDRSTDMRDEVDWGVLDRRRVVEDFKAIFNNRANVQKEAYFDSMTHFDFKCLLPALLHVEDRMSMAHGLETRVPLLDHPLVEFAATVPADVKFEGGHLKRMLKNAFGDVLPHQIVHRRDKMGFPVPLKEWFAGPLRRDVVDIFQNMREKHRPYIRADAVLHNFGQASRFSRKTWGLLGLELWHQTFHDQAADYRAMLDEDHIDNEVVLV